MTGFGKKWQLFLGQFIGKKAYQLVLIGLRNTLIIAVVGLAIGIVIGTLIAVIKLIPSKSPVIGFFKKLGTVYVGFFRGTPIVVQLLLGYFVLFPLLGVHVSSFATAVIIFGLNSAAYVSEIMRSGLLSVDYGQLEASRALGLAYGYSMWKVVVPQAVKNILPTLGNELIALLKDTSVVSFVAAPDLFLAFTGIANTDYDYMVPYLALALVYIVLVLIFTALIKLLERRMRASDKR